MIRQTVPKKHEVLCIVVPDLFHATQTFFHEHIAKIAPGQTVIVHLSSTGAPAQTSVPVLEVTAPSQWTEKGGRLLSRLIRSVNAWRTYRLSSQQAEAIESYLLREGITHVFAEFATTGFMIAPVTARLGLPLTVMSHGWDINVMGRGRLWRGRFKSFFNSKTKFVAVCEFLKDRMTDIGAPENKVAVVPCVIEASLFNPVLHRRGPTRVVMLSRLTAQKGPLHSLRAFAEASKHNPDLVLDIIGDGPLMGAVRWESERLNLLDRVCLHGALPHDHALAILARSNIFLQHCVTLPFQGIESQAVSLLEAMGHGLVPIVTRHGGMTEHVANEVRGFVVNEGDEANMAARILHLADRPEERNRMGKNARLYVLENFAGEKIYPRLRTLIGLAETLPGNYQPSSLQNYPAK
ncbi:glycosyltransferase family 4 protein [Altererythrobacter sp. SALINAS58]|uniref:glycosyltransferase family 4 protein n=1 Tax=Alteripontixanthobacter muriae TaxID=2705546 RepID=UPI001576BD29|nr:glycosyltransferase family 4 protein [Alteripontixanthobacter muriae]NTZ43962.1 glycosyltransferase family 4 protein [Alteripontixanthobacter muriae]